MVIERACNAPPPEGIAGYGDLAHAPRRSGHREFQAKEEITRSDIVLPDTATDKPQEGTVLAVGPGRLPDTGTRLEMDVKEGDTVLFTKYGGTQVKLDGRDYLVIRESDLLAIITNGTSN